MLIFLKTILKISFLLLFFSWANNELLACKGILNIHFKNDNLVSAPFFSPDYFFIQEHSDDTIPTKNNDDKVIKTEEEFTIPNRLAGNIFTFQVNSDITYRNFGHFVKNQSRKIFFQAWLLEKELLNLTSETDSLRKIYSSSASEQKEAITVLILKNEQRIISLNQEIPVLYQNAREEEDQYWKSASGNEIVRFQEKIKIINDSIELANHKFREQNKDIYTSTADTLILDNEPPKTPEAKPEISSEIVYKIQIGAYKGKIPDPASKLIKKLSTIRKIENYTDDKGVKVFTTGNLRNYNEALTLQSQVKQEGVKTPVIAAYLKGKRITLSEARKLNNEL
ncbi:MAG TPA: hypothetical protein DCR40_10555 [Prolixibacteraceae bacterium]|nr:hypothetical protein [Prolixibacteraceae bacterium]